MGGQTEAYVQLAAQAAETLVWLVVAFASLARARAAHPVAWTGPAAVGAVLLLVPAMTLTFARAELIWGGTATIIQNYTASALPTVFAVLRVIGAALLLAALLAGRRPAASAPDTA